MTPGVRTHRTARLRLVTPQGVPEEMREGMREIASLFSEDRGQGHARALMHQVCAEADRAGIVLLLTAEAVDGLTQEQLERFYGRFGFVKVQEQPVLMARQVQALRIARAA